jgi:hypothetical protein
MWRDWWTAHRAEVYWDLGFASLFLAGVLVIAVVQWFGKRKRS